MKLCFWLHVCSTAWGLWNFAIAFYSVPDNLSVFDFVWNLISSDEIPANGMIVGYGTCLWRMWAATHCVCLLPFFLAESRPVWGVPSAVLAYTAARGCALGTSMKRCLNSGLTSAEAQHLQNLDFPHPRVMSHSFSEELQHWRFLFCCQELGRLQGRQSRILEWSTLTSLKSNGTKPPEEEVWGRPLKFKLKILRVTHNLSPQLCWQVRGLCLRGGDKQLRGVRWVSSS